MTNFFEERIAKREGAGFSVGGKIRVGTKAISKRAAENQTAMKFYQLVQSGRLSFRDAEKEIAARTDIKNPFYPRNTREFHAHPWDMGTGCAATTQKLLALYGEMLEGDTEPRLYRFPIVFPEVGRDVSAIVQGGMAVQGGGPNTVRHWSAYDESGLRVCKHLPEVQRSEMAQRRNGKAIRHPERQAVVRGPCVPETCMEYGAGMCRFNGTVRFYIPGITGAGVFELHTGSTNAATEIYLRVTSALRAMGNRLVNYTPDGRPVFWLTKKKATRKYFDEEGNPKIGEQWVPEIDIEVEMPKVIMIAQARADNTSGQNDAPRAPLAWAQADDDGQVNAAVADMEAQTSEPLQGDPQPKSQAAPQTQASREDVTDVHPKAPVAQPKPEPAEASQTSVSQMREHAKSYGYEEQLTRWVQARQGGNDDKAVENWIKLSERFGPRVKDYLDLTLYAGEMGLEADLMMAYLKKKFGSIGTGAHLVQMLAAVKDLCSDGASVAITVMEGEIESATS